MLIPPLAPGQVCLGVALMVPGPLAQTLAQARRAFGDPEPSAPHVTLIPPTPLEESAVPGCLAQIRRTAQDFPPFQVHLHGTGTFRPVSPVVYVQLEEGFEYCQALAERLRPVLPQTCNRFPYHPHVTLADLTDTEALDRAQYAMNALDECFEVLEVAVSEFHPERGWRLLSALPLGGSKPPGQILPPALGDAQ